MKEHVLLNASKHSASPTTRKAWLINLLSALLHATAQLRNQLQQLPTAAAASQLLLQEL
jgi:hypothetical protein